jgi:SAM-dependent methyltransferase
MQNFPNVTLAADDVDGFVAEADRLAGESHALRNEFLMSRSLPYVPAPAGTGELPDPFGAEYLSWVTDQWRMASGRQEYRLELEQDNNIRASNEQLTRLYPFVSGDVNFIAQYMMGVYHALKHMSDLPNRHVVEYGVGWGNSSVALLQAGFDLTAVDIDPSWLKLLELRANLLGVGARLRIHHGQFGELPRDCTMLGGALFYECFHHALNHDKALENLSQSMAEGGVVIFAGETIYRDFPVDWGVRLDGHAVWAIRRYGWMELGFSEDYFIRLCRRHNLELTRHICEAAGPFGVVYKAIKRARGWAMGRSLLTSTEIGFYDWEADPSVNSRFSNGYCKLDLPCSGTRVEIELRNWLSVGLQCSISQAGMRLWEGYIDPLSSLHVPLPNPETGYFRCVEISSDSYRPADLGINNDSRELGVAIGDIRFCCD